MTNLIKNGPILGLLVRGLNAIDPKMSMLTLSVVLIDFVATILIHNEIQIKFLNKIRFTYYLD